MNDNRFFVYLLVRPWNRVPCYVGKGCGDRPQEHFRLSRGNKHYNLHLQNLIKKADGQLPIIIVKRGLTNTEAYALETDLIAKYGRKSNGGCLANMTDGGDGHLGMEPEVRERIRRKLTGRKLPEAHRQATSAGLKTSLKAAKHISDLADWRRGRPLSEHHKLNIRKPVPADEVTRRYLDGASMNEIARHYGVTETLIADRLDETGTPRRSRSEAKVLSHRRSKEQHNA